MGTARMHIHGGHAVGGRCWSGRWSVGSRCCLEMGVDGLVGGLCGCWFVLGFRVAMYGVVEVLLGWVGCLGLAHCSYSVGFRSFARQTS